MTELAWQDPLRGGAVAREGFRLVAAEDLALLRLQLLAWDRDAGSRAAAALGRALPATGCVVAGEGYRVAGRAPGHWLFIAAAGESASLAETLEKALAACTAAVTPATDGQVVLRLTGPARERVLARGTTLDLGALAPGQCAATRFAGVPVLLVPEADAMLVLACRSLAVYLRDWCDAASADCC
ncbi:MAG: sarcosine oxidase subunit gamma family protein [Pseudohaliea sp.]